MVDLPEYRSQDLAQQIGVVRPDFGAGLDQLSADARSVAGTFGQMAEEEGVANAAQKGGQAAVAASLERTPDGTLQPLPWRSNDSPENIAYNAAMKAGVIADFENDQFAKAREFQSQFPDDPEGFRTVWQGHTDGTLSALDPQLAPLAQQKLAQIGTETQNSIFRAARDRDWRLAYGNWSASLDQKESDIESMAGAGQTQHPAYQQLVNDYVSTLNQGVAARFIGQDAADVKRTQVADQGEALAISKHALDAYRAAGGGPAGETAAMGLLDRIDSPSLQISPKQRDAIESMTRRRIGEEEAIRHQQVSSLWQQAQPLLDKLHLGVNVDPGAVENIRQGLINAGAPDMAAKIETEATLQQQVRALAQLPLDQQQVKLAQYQEAMDDGSATDVEARLANALPGMMKAKAQALQADPFGYGAQAHPDLVGPVTPVDWTQPPAALAPVLAQRAAQADKLANYEGVFVPPLSTPELKNLSAAIISDPEHAPAMLNTIQSAAGQAWSSVWRGLTTQGALPTEYQAVADVGDHDPAQAVLLARGLAEYGKTGKNLTDLLPPRANSGPTGIDQLIESSTDWQQLRMSLSRSGASAGMQDSILGAMKTLAYSNVVYAGKDPASAADAAIKAFTSQYDFMPNGGARVPAAVFSNVNAVAQETLNRLAIAPADVPGLLTPGNIDLAALPKNADGSISPVHWFRFEDNGKTSLIFTGVGDRVVSNAEAVAEYKKTGQHLGIFKDEASAADYAETLNEHRDKTYSGQPLIDLMVSPIFRQPGQPKPDDYLRTLKAAPTWVTAPQGNALWLMDSGGRIVRDKTGAPIAVPFDAQPSPSAYEPPPGLGG